MGEQRRRRLDTRSWREVMLRFGEADMTVSAFCAREGLSTSSFYRWRERLGSVGDAGGAALPRGGRSQLAAAASRRRLHRPGTPGHAAA